MPESRPPTFLFLASHFKGGAMLQQAKELGCYVILLTKERFAKDDWPRESIDELHYMPELAKRPDIFHAVSYLARSRQIDRILPLDDYDVETAAALREHLRLPGMGETTARYFRDKLAMRMQARDKGVRVPEFMHVLNYDRLREFMDRVPAPWVLKPRSEAGAMGIKKINTAEELWRRLDVLGDEQSFFLMEQFVAGDVYHVDSIIWEREVVFDIAHKYGRPPMSVSHEGGAFTTRTLSRDSDEARDLFALNREVMSALGMLHGVTHAEYIRGAADGQLYFLETAARVGGANIAEMIEFATGLNLWREWARLENAHTRGEAYQVPAHRQDYAGIIICLAKQDQPDLSGYQDPEIVWRLVKANHAGLIVASPDLGRVLALLNEYGERFTRDFVTWMPPLDKPDD